MRNAVLEAVIVLLTLMPPVGVMALELTCDAGKRMAVFGDQSTDNIIELHWGGDAYRMQRVPTSTGAHRFEHAGSGLIWISIPSKAMLLDRKLGMPVANECRSGTTTRTRR